MTVLSPSSLVCEFFVEGKAEAEGSMIVRHTKDGRAYAVAANDNELRKWRKQVAAAAQLNFWSTQIEGAVVLLCDFKMARPKTVTREFPSVRPDVDKMARAVADAITQSGVWKDDGQVVSLIASKVYAEVPGVSVRIHELEGTTDG